MDRSKFRNPGESPDLDMGVKFNVSEKLRQFFSKGGNLKFALLFAAAGILLLLWPTQRTDDNIQPVARVTVEEEAQDLSQMEAKMEQVLSCVAGAGQVRVMLTVKDGGETEYQTDLERSRNGDQTEEKSQTVFLNQSGSALIRKKSEPAYLGALVICQGADSAKVRYEITCAVCSLTGLGSDRVTVLKMENYF